jgi:hypothetical protein
LQRRQAVSCPKIWHGYSQADIVLSDWVLLKFLGESPAVALKISEISQLGNFYATGNKIDNEYLVNLQHRGIDDM